MILGKDIVLMIGGTPIAAAKSCNLDKQQSFLQVASPTSGKWEQSLPERLSWSASCDCLIGTMAAYTMLSDAQDNGTALTLRIKDAGTIGLNKTGTCYVESLHLEGSTGNLAKMSVTLKGSGALSTYQGEPIVMTLYSSHTGERVDVSGESVTFVDDGESVNRLCTFTLGSRSLIKIVPNDEVVIISTNMMIEQFYDDSHDFLLSTLQATNYTQTTELWMDAGVYYALISNLDDAQDPAQFYIKS